jgi:hypothetical protein
VRCCERIHKLGSAGGEGVSCAAGINLLNGISAMGGGGRSLS